MRVPSSLRSGDGDGERDFVGDGERDFVGDGDGERERVALGLAALLDPFSSLSAKSFSCREQYSPPHLTFLLQFSP